MYVRFGGCAVGQQISTTMSWALMYVRSSLFHEQHPKHWHESDASAENRERGHTSKDAESSKLVWL